MATHRRLVATQRRLVEGSRKRQTKEKKVDLSAWPVPVPMPVPHSRKMGLSPELRRSSPALTDESERGREEFFLSLHSRSSSATDPVAVPDSRG